MEVGSSTPPASPTPNSSPPPPASPTSASRTGGPWKPAFGFPFPAYILRYHILTSPCRIPCCRRVGSVVIRQLSSSMRSPSGECLRPTLSHWSFFYSIQSCYYIWLELLEVGGNGDEGAGSVSSSWSAGLPRCTGRPLAGPPRPDEGRHHQRPHHRPPRPRAGRSPQDCRSQGTLPTPHSRLSPSTQREAASRSSWAGAGRRRGGRSWGAWSGTGRRAWQAATTPKPASTSPPSLPPSKPTPPLVMKKQEIHPVR